MSMHLGIFFLFSPKKSTLAAKHVLEVQTLYIFLKKWTFNCDKIKQRLLTSILQTAMAL